MMSMAQFQAQYVAQNPWLWLSLLALISLLIGVQIGRWLAGSRYKKLLEQAELSSTAQALEPSAEIPKDAEVIKPVRDQASASPPPLPPPSTSKTKSVATPEALLRTEVSQVSTEHEPSAGRAPALIGDLVGITQKHVDKLSAKGIDTISQLINATNSRSDREDLADALQIEDFVVTKWRRMAELMKLPNMSPQTAEFLVFAGINSVTEMAKRNAESMHHKMQNLNQKEQRIDQVPTRQQLEQWISANNSS